MRGLYVRGATRGGHLGAATVSRLRLHPPAAARPYARGAWRGRAADGQPAEQLRRACLSGTRAIR